MSVVKSTTAKRDALALPSSAEKASSPSIIDPLFRATGDLEGLGR